MDSSDKKMRVVIAGGGTAGWLAAAALSHQLGGQIELSLVESTDIGTVGVGEATIPPMKTFHRFLRIDEREFMRATHATFKLGIQFENWKTLGEKYFHSFGTTGKGTLVTEFLHFWMRGRELGIAKEFGDYCLEHKAGLAGKCAAYTEPGINYAFHLDAGKYAEFLKSAALKRGVKHFDGKISQVIQNPENGNIRELQLENGEKISGDFFIDCSGFRALLIEQSLHVGYEDWSHWLPCDSAVALQTEASQAPVPYTRSIAHQSGWQWQIPLQHRVGNGLVYCSKYMGQDDALNCLLSNIQGKAITEPKHLRFRTGRRRKSLYKNCLALGLASGFLEPLESTSIHMIMTSITRLLQLFSSSGIPQVLVDEFNNQAKTEAETIRDFIILHYKVTERIDSCFWRHCRGMEIPKELAHRIDLFKYLGKSIQKEGELFRLDSWTQVMLGQGLYPQRYHPAVNAMKRHDLESFLQGIYLGVDQTVKKLPTHNEFVKSYCGI